MDKDAPRATESADEVLGAIYHNFPRIMEAYNRAVVPTEWEKYRAAENVSEPYQKLNAYLYDKYAPMLADTQRGIDTKDKIVGANTDVALLGKQGRDLSRVYQQIDKEANPEFYKTRELASNKLGALLSGINPDAPDIEAERLINAENIRSGNTSPSATGTVANALMFGDQRLKRQAALSNAISTATGFLQPSRVSEFNPATTVLNKPTNNAGTSQFGGVTKTGNEAFSAGEGFMNSVSSFQNNAMQINANKRDALDRVNETLSAL